MLKRIREVNWDTVAKKFILKESSGKKTEVSITEAPSETLAAALYYDAPGPSPIATFSAHDLPNNVGDKGAIRQLIEPLIVFGAGDGVGVFIHNHGESTIQLKAYILVTNPSGTEALGLASGKIPIAAGFSDWIAFPTPASPITGSDLSYNATTKHIVSAAGGPFAMSVDLAASLT